MKLIHSPFSGSTSLFFGGVGNAYLSKPPDIRLRSGKLMLGSQTPLAFQALPEIIALFLANIRY